MPFEWARLPGEARFAMQPHNTFREISPFFLADRRKLFQIVHAKLPMVEGHSISRMNRHDPRT
jgi:hypothetical protein